MVLLVAAVVAAVLGALISMGVAVFGVVAVAELEILKMALRQPFAIATVHPTNLPAYMNIASWCFEV